MIQRIRTNLVRKGDILHLPERTHKVTANPVFDEKSGVTIIETHSLRLQVTDPNRIARVDLWLPKLKRKKVGNANYDILDDSGAVVGNAVRTGRPGVDNYPWNWSVDFKTIDGSRTVGNGSTLAECIDYISNAVRQREDR